MITGQPEKIHHSIAALSATSVHPFVYARHGRDCNGVQVPCTRLGVSRSSGYQMIAPIDKVLDEGNRRTAKSGIEDFDSSCWFPGDVVGCGSDWEVWVGAKPVD